MRQQHLDLRAVRGRKPDALLGQEGTEIGRRLIGPDRARDGIAQIIALEELAVQLEVGRARAHIHNQVEPRMVHDQDLVASRPELLQVKPWVELAQGRQRRPVLLGDARGGVAGLDLDLGNPY